MDSEYAFRKNTTKIRGTWYSPRNTMEIREESELHARFGGGETVTCLQEHVPYPITGQTPTEALKKCDA